MSSSVGRIGAGAAWPRAVAVAASSVSATSATLPRIEVMEYSSRCGGAAARAEYRKSTTRTRHAERDRHHLSLLLRPSGRGCPERAGPERAREEGKGQGRGHCGRPIRGRAQEHEGGREDGRLALQ